MDHSSPNSSMGANGVDYSQHHQQPLADSNANYSNIVITSSPLKNSNFYFNDEISGFDGIIQNENINHMIKGSSHDVPLQYLHHNQHQEHPIPHQQHQHHQLQLHPYQPTQHQQDNNETDDEKTDDESGNNLPSEDHVVPAHHSNIQYFKHPQQQQQPQHLQPPQMLQFAPNIQHMDQFQAQQMFQGQLQQQRSMPHQFIPHPSQQQQPMYPPQQQTNLYPPVEYFPSRIPESTSNNTISSYESAPFMISSSVSDNSIASPASFNTSSHNTTLMTPQRQYNITGGGGASARRTSISMTPIPFETPSRSQSFIGPQQIPTSPANTRVTPRRSTTNSSASAASKSHRRTRSRLSLDPSGSASIITTLQTSLSEHRLNTLARSPSIGTNPFYPHSSSLLSPHPPGSRLTTSHSLNNLNSPISTPLATPGSLKRNHYLDDDEDYDTKERLRKISSISPNMLMNRSFLESVEDHEEPREENQQQQQQQHHHHHHHHHDSKSIKFDAGFDSSQTITFPLTNFTNLDLMNDKQFNPGFLCDPSNAEITEHTPLKSSPEKPLSKKKQLSRSQSSINLKSYTSDQDLSQYPRGEDLIKERNLKDHPLIDKSLKYDRPIVLGRKKISKSSSSTSLTETTTTTSTTTITSTATAATNAASSTPKGKSGKPKKLHPCPLCDVVLQRPEHVKRHMNSHSSEKPFVCEEPGCGVRFNRKDNLRAHIRNIHHMNI